MGVIKAGRYACLGSPVALLATKPCWINLAFLRGTPSTTTPPSPPPLNLSCLSSRRIKRESTQNTTVERCTPMGSSHRPFRRTHTVSHNSKITSRINGGRSPPRPLLLDSTRTHGNKRRHLSTAHAAASPHRPQQPPERQAAPNGPMPVCGALGAAKPRTPLPGTSEVHTIVEVVERFAPQLGTHAASHPAPTPHAGCWSRRGEGKYSHVLHALAVRPMTTRPPEDWGGGDSMRRLRPAGTESA